MRTTKQLPTIHFETHPHYELGDTHFTYQQVAEITGYKRATISRHTRRGPLQDCSRVRIRGGYQKKPSIALEYDATLHSYLQERRAPVSTDVLAQLAQRMSPVEISDHLKERSDMRSMGPSAISMRLHRHGVETPAWSDRRRKERAYTRQMEAQRMDSRGADIDAIAEKLNRGRRTVQRYLRGYIDRPAQIEGRTPIWEQDHDLW